MIYLTADLHFGHSNVIKFRHRPFQTAEEMDKELIRRWNDKILPKDEVFILGDLTLKGPRKANMLLEQLQGRKYLIKGNHDGYVDRAAFHREHFQWIRDYHELTWQGRRFVLCHYPLLSWNGMRRGVFHLHGHLHNHQFHNEYNREMLITRLDVGVDAWAMAPVSMEELTAFWEEENPPDEYWGSVKPSELRLEMTSIFCPEQYDVFGRDGQYLGYLRLRRNSFRVICCRSESSDDEEISEYTTTDWGMLTDDQERSQYLSIARRDIAKFYRKLEKGSQSP